MTLYAYVKRKYTCYKNVDNIEKNKDKNKMLPPKPHQLGITTVGNHDWDDSKSAPSLLCLLKLANIAAIDPISQAKA